MNVSHPFKQYAADYLKSRILPIASRYVGRYSLVGNKTFFEEKSFYPWIARLEASWEVIRDEMEEVRKSQYIPGLHEISPALNRLAGDNKWKTLFLIANQDQVAANCRECPETTRLIEQIPDVNSAFFSILLPGKHIPAHDGVYNGLLRYHLGLKVPSDNTSCTLRVGNDRRHWSAGESLLFDDCFEHEAWNNSEEDRVVLIIDVLRPLAFPLAQLNKAVVRLTTQTSWARDANKTLETMSERSSADK